MSHCSMVIRNYVEIASQDKGKTQLQIRREGGFPFYFLTSPENQSISYQYEK